jgi:acyl carrier protein
VTRVEVESSIRAVLETVLGRPIAAGENPRRDDETAWDSLRHVELVFGIEEALGIQFGAEELGELDTYDKLVASARRAREPGD